MRKILPLLLCSLTWIGLVTSSAQAQTCAATSVIDYNQVLNGTRKAIAPTTYSDAANGITVTYSNYSSNVNSGTSTGNNDIFAVGSNTILNPAGDFLVWQQDNQGVNPGGEVQLTGATSNNRGFVTLTFTKAVSNLTLKITDVDLDRTNANFIDRVTFDGYPTASSTTPVTLVNSNFTFGTNGSGQQCQRFVGSGYSPAAGGITNTNPVGRNNAVTGIRTSTANRASDMTVTFPSPVTRVVLTYENVAPFTPTSTFNSIDRTQTIGLVTMGWCRQTEVAASLTGPTTLLAGQPTGVYTATFTNEGSEDLSSVTQTATLPAGASLSTAQRQNLITRYGLTTSSFTTTGSGATAVTAINFGTAATLVSGAANSFSFAFTAPAATGTSTLVDNTGTSTPEADLVPNSASLTLTTVEAADLVADITPTAATVAPGGAASFTVTVTNTGLQSAANTTAVVQLPAGLTAYGAVTAAGGTYDNATGQVTYASFTLAGGGTASSLISFTMPPSGVVPATISTTTTTTETNYANNTDASTIATAVQFDLSTTISGPTTAVAGSPITLNVTTTNTGQAASNVLQTVELPQGLTNVYVSSGGYYNGTAAAVTGNFVNGNFVAVAGGSVTIAAGNVAFPPVGTLPGGQTVANNVTFNSPAGAVGALTYSPTARVATQTGETSTTNNSATTTITPTLTPTATTANVFAILSITAETLPSGASTTATIVPAATKVTYTAGVGNGGTGTATNSASGVTEQLQLVPGLGVGTLTVGGNAGTASGTGNTAIVTYTYGSSTATYNVTTGLLTLPTLTTLASDVSSTTSVVLTLPTTLANDGRLLATMSVGSATSDLIASDNVKAVTIRVLPTTDVQTTITGPASALPGQAVSYKATFGNNGPDAATGTTETLQLPAGLSAVTVTDDIAGTTVTGATYTTATGVLTLPNIASNAVGATQRFTVSFVAPAQLYSVSSTVGTTTADTTPANNVATMTTDVTPTADVAVTITGPATAVADVVNVSVSPNANPSPNASTQTPVRAGNLVNYTVTTLNNGALAASTVATTLQLPANLSNVTVSGSGSYVSSTGLVTFDALASLPAGTSRVNYVTFTMPTNPTNNQVVGTARVTTTSPDLVPANNTAGIVTAVYGITSLEPANLAVDITTVPATPSNPGATLNYVFAFRNPGSLNVNYVQQQANLPAGLSAASLRIASQLGTLNATSGLLVFPNNATYNPTSGAVSFPTGTLNAGGSNSYAVSFPAPSSGQVLVTGTITSGVLETTIADNQDSNTTTITSSYDATTKLSGPATALPGAASTYAVTTTNGGPSTAPSITQTVTLPKNLTAADLLVAGQTGTPALGTLTFSNTGATYNSGTGVLTFPAITNLAAGATNGVTNSFTVTMPATGSLPLTANVTSAGESNTGNNSDNLSTAAANRPPVAQNIVNSLRSARANNAASALPISPLVATDPDGSIPTTNGYTIVGLPTTAQGVLSYNGAAATANQVISDPALLSFKPASGFVGNAFFTYTATDNLGAVSTPALYTIPVASDLVSTYTATPIKGGATPYSLNDVVTYLIDPNGAVYNNGGLVYSPNGTAATQTGNLSLNNGVTSAVVNTVTNTTGAPTTLAAIGLQINPTTGQIFVSTPTLLKPGTYTVNITTTDVYGGTNTVTELIVIPNNPLPVSLTVFTAQAVANRDALLKWNTATEVNNDHFEVERSFDGRSFVHIGTVAGQGTKLTPTEYALTDANVAAKATGPVYYRLRQVDQDGTAAYSPVRSVSFTAGDSSQGISVYPNPVANGTELDLTKLPAGTYQVTLLDATGRAVRSYSLTAGLTHSLELADIDTGAYLLMVRGTDATGTPSQFVTRLLKK